MRPGSAMRMVGAVAAVAVILLAGFVVAWRMTGGRLERVETPSMGTVAPVGSLLWVRPVDPGHLRPGEFITFHPPGQPGVTYSHRVRAVYADGTIATQGVISAPDPWRLNGSDVVGRVVMTWWGVGWALEMAPLLLLGALLIALVVRSSAPTWRAAVALSGASVVLAVAIVVYRPFVAADQLAFRPVGHGARATYVGTGLMPIRLQAEGGGQVRLRDGEVGSVVVPTADADGRYVVRLRPDVPWWFWVALVLGCLSPAALASGRRVREEYTGRATPASATPAHPA